MIMQATSQAWVKGKEANGAETFTKGNIVITRHKVSGVQVWRQEGAERVLVGVGYRSVEAAKAYIEGPLA